MNDEIEVKILEIDEASVQEKLISLGAQKTFEGNVEWLVFDSPDGNLSKNEVLVRLRKIGDKTQLTVKKLVNTEKAKVSKEFEIVVDNFEKAKLILENIGLKQKKGYPLKKHRISYLLKDVHFEIDKFSQFPTYLEIEAPNHEAIQGAVKNLGFLPSDVKPWGTRELFAYYRSKSHI